MKYSYQWNGPIASTLFFLLLTAIRWLFKCVFAFKLQHKATCRLIYFPYKETSSLQKIIVLQTVESLICSKVIAPYGSLYRNSKPFQK